MTDKKPYTPPTLRKLTREEVARLGGLACARSGANARTRFSEEDPKRAREAGRKGGLVNSTKRKTP